MGIKHPSRASLINSIYIKAIKGVYECPWCKERAPRIAVHGHYQCSKCGKNVDECCQGEKSNG